MHTPLEKDKPIPNVLLSTILPPCSLRRGDIIDETGMGAGCRVSKTGDRTSRGHESRVLQQPSDESLPPAAVGRCGEMSGEAITKHWAGQWTRHERLCRVAVVP
eukprot:gene16613-biopygen2483